jgi:hypothetical protein
MPLKVAMACGVSGKGKEKGRAIESMFLAKLLKLFGRRLLTQD